MGRGILWWIAGFILYGIANSILRDLQSQVAAKRERWENLYEELEREVDAQQSLLQEEINNAEEELNYRQISALHSQSAELADRAYSLLSDSRETLDAMGNAIVNAAKQRKILQQKKREAAYSEKKSIQEEIDGLHELRDDVLIPDKDSVKEQRNSLLQKVKILNKQTAQLRDLKANSRSRQQRQVKDPAKENCRGYVKFYNTEKGFGFIKTDDCKKDVYVNAKQLANSNKLETGEQVIFDLNESDKPWATRVKSVVSSSS